LAIRRCRGVGWGLRGADVPLGCEEAGAVVCACEELADGAGAVVEEEFEGVGLDDVSGAFWIAGADVDGVCVSVVGAVVVDPLGDCANAAVVKTRLRGCQ